MKSLSSKYLETQSNWLYPGPSRMTAVALDDLLTLRQIAALLNASYPFAWRLAASGKLGQPTIVGASHLYARAKVEAAAAATHRRAS